ncbi:putative conjugative transposon membrane protein [Streptococcus pneumoniae]|uniref:PBECR4 domain-containing protein n=1 Tax=Streptococcus pneumoniae TaxID=1313 RepID=UPI00102403C7|nr:PBECR4 domain-containing protein [Streptococcus pneumoniae]VFH64490.1 putative conjugative transposon membrane protein [Streptococcus pneumoniae]VKR42187.1 putative conjugative transposon membrane protein [Streptococcus pneumoniae]
MTEQESRRGKSRRERVEFARSRDILDVANDLQMELVRSGRDYRWKEHDSLVISPDKNLWKWFSRNTGGDAISLVETIKEVSFNQSVDFLNDGNFKEFQMVERPQEDFKYYLEKYEQPFSAGRDYLRNQRGLSDETIDYFLEQGVLAQANAKLDYFAEGNSGSSTNAIEPVIVFKSLSSSGEVVGASLQGIQENWEKWPKHGYAKVIMKNSDPMTGIHVNIGSPKRLIFTESPIDLMSYYELHKDSLQDVRLVSMDGLKESTIGRHLSQIQAEMSGKALIWTPEQLADGLQVAIDRHFFENKENADLITLALDNDNAGRTFIQELEAKGAVINSDLPELRPGQDKTDWNDALRTQNQQSLVDLSAVSVENEKSFNNPLDLVRELHRKWEDELAEKIREDLGINHELQAWQFEKEMSRFITTDLDKLFAKRTRLERDAYFADSATSIRKEIDRLDAQILEYIEKAPEQSQEKTDWNEILKQEKQLERDVPDNSRLAQARRKLERLKGEQDEAISRAYSHQALTNGQPMNDKRGSASFMRKQEQIEGQVFSKMDEIRQQEERVERLEHQQHLKEMGLNRQGSGLDMSVQNIPRIREELEKAKRGESFFTKATLKRYQEELTRLEAISEQMGKTSIQPATQALIDEGLVNQWKKQPNTYFVKGLRRVALELTEEGEFQLSSQIKYHPKTDEERLKVDELLAKQRQENVGLTPSNQEKSISPQPDPIEKNQGEAGWLEKNWDNLTFSIENKKTVVIDPTSIDKMVEEKQTPDNQESITTTEENAGRLMSYEEVKRENEALTKSLNNRIQSGELSIEFASDFYLYDVFAKLGNSHPTKYLNTKRMEVVSPIHSLLTSIDDRTVDLYKKKGTPEQDSLYQALKPHQRTLGVDISTQFIGELAIAAYNSNKQIESLSSDSFGVYFGERTLDNLSQSIERMLEYPLIESGTRDFTYGFVVTPNTLYHYLEEQEGEVVLNRELLDNLMSRLEAHPIKMMEASEEKEKSLEDGQETTDNSEQNKKVETKLGDFPEETQGAAPLPEANVSQPLNDLSPSQTRSQPLLHFSINEERKSIHKDNYHPISDKDLLKLNRYAPHLQNAAQWYLENVADSQVIYFYQDGADTNSVAISYNKESFMHLTGIYPYREGQTAEQTLLDFATGNGQFDNILIANRGAAFDKLKVLPELPTMVDAESFYFGDLSDVEKFHTLNLDKAIRSNDQDVLLAFRTVDGTVLPASLMRLRQSLNLLLNQTNQEKIILGVFRERDGHIDQLSINEEYVKDGGEEMLSILKNKQYEEVSEEPEPPAPENTLNNSLLDANKFTQVLDTVYNLGVPSDISKTPEEFHQAWNQYLDYAKQYNDKFDQIVAVAGEDNLLDKNSDFYRDWHQDHIYKDDHHIRLQWSEDRPGGPKLPFKETELISYQDFARELYKANQDFYPIHQEGMKQVTAGNTEGYIPPTKIKFDVYAPGGEMIKEGIRYDIGDETTPISQMLGLGYRRLNGQSVLASMDEEILSQLENREVNKEISQEANESARLTEEVAGQTPDTRETVAFQSSKQETKTNLLQRVEEILKEEPISDLEPLEVNSSSIDYATLTPHELSEVAFKKVREYTETPERLEEYLNFMSKFPELSPRNVALIQEQWPGASAVATYNQWQSMGEVLGITSDQVFETRNTYTNKKTGRTREVVHNNLSVKTGEKSHITLFRPMMVEMIPVLDENGNQVKNGKGNPKYKRLSEATPEEKALKKEGKLKSRFFQERDSNTGLAKFATYKVFELSQTTLKPEFYPKAMPNRHYDFNMDHIRTKEVLEGLSDYAKNIGVTIYQDDAKELRSAKGSFYPDEQKILLNPDNTPGEVVATTIHELAHASLHNPKFANSYKEDVSKNRRELEAEMTSYLVSKHFGLDTSEKAIRYMAIWTDNLTSLDDQQLAQSMKRIHGTVSKIVKSVEQHTKPYQLNRQVVQNQNFIQSPKKGLKV